MKFSKKLKIFFQANILVLALAFTLGSCDTLMEDLESVSMYAQLYNLTRGLDYALHKYTVKHYFQNINDDEYTLQATEYKDGTLGEQTKAVAKDSEGFTSQSFEQKTIEENTIVEIYYTRNKYTLSYTDNLDDEDISVPSSVEYKYGAIVNVNFTDIEQSENFKYWNTKSNGTGTTYTSTGTKTFAMPAANVTLYAIWKGYANYTVKHLLQDLDLIGYTEQTADTEVKLGKVGYATDAAPKTTYTGFTTTVTSIPDIQQTIREDGTVVIEIKYNRNLHDLTYDKNCSDTVTIPTSEIDVPYGKHIDVDFTVSSRLGYTFAGWNTASDGSGTAYTSSGVTSFEMPDSDVTLYAQWQITTLGGGGITINFPINSTTTENLTVSISVSDGSTTTPWTNTSNPIVMASGKKILFTISPTGTYNSTYWILDGSIVSTTGNTLEKLSTDLEPGNHSLIIYKQNSTTEESALGQINFIISE